MTLIIVESPTKARTIKKILGSKYDVLASFGHIKDLPDSKKGTSIKKKSAKGKKTTTKAKKTETVDPNLDLRLGINTKTYEPIYVFTDKSKKIAAEIKTKSKEHDLVLVSTDPDREGESIAAHIAEVVGDPKKIKRAAFHEITEKEIKHQIEHAGSINYDLVEAQKARRVLDRLVGYKVSPLLWKKFFIGLSAGRVQSVALKAVVEREQEIQAFIPTIWFDAMAWFKGIMFTFVQKDKEKATLKTEDDANRLIADITGNTFTITSIETSESKRHPSPPFTTSTLQQTASSKLGFTPKRTMTLAQQLFEAGKISYHRTDSVNLSEDFIKSVFGYISKVHGADYAQSRRFATKSKNAQEAHEAIRPTSLVREPDGLAPDQQKLYNLIFSRAVASQMSPAVISKTDVVADVAGTKHQFKSGFQSIVFPGYAAVYDADIGETVANPFTQGQTFIPEKLEYKETSTKPPARYSEATLIKFLEEQGIGRPSTYASIISTILERKYVESFERRLKPTDIGIAVTGYLDTKFKDILDYQFTAGMEQKLDDIAGGERKYIDVMREFDEPFEKTLQENLGDTAKANVGAITDTPCPICGKPMVEKLGRFGKFLSCQDYPTCTGIVRLTSGGETDTEAQTKLAEKAVSHEFLAIHNPAPKTDDGRDYLLKKGRFGEFWAHPDYPKTKDIQSLTFTTEHLKKTFGEPPKASDGKIMILKKGRFGYFWSHPDYPKVKEFQKAKKIK